MPRDIPNLTKVWVYHPPPADNKDMSNHLNKGIETLNTIHPNTGLMLLGDFNTFSDWYLTRVLSLSQLVEKPTRRRANCLRIYKKWKIIAHLGKSDHNAFVCSPKDRITYDKWHIKLKSSRVQGQNEKVIFCKRDSTNRLDPIVCIWLRWSQICIFRNGNDSHDQFIFPN